MTFLYTVYYLVQWIEYKYFIEHSGSASMVCMYDAPRYQGYCWGIVRDLDDQLHGYWFANLYRE